MLIRFLSAPSKGGLGTDVAMVESAIRRAHIKIAPKTEWKFEYVDPHLLGANEITVSDINIHFEIPVRLAVPYGRYNICMVNAEWFQLDSWNWAFSPESIDLFVFKSGHVPNLFPELDAKRYVICPWTSPMKPEYGVWSKKEERFLYLLSESVSKEAAAKDVVAGWQPGWPTLELWCSVTFADTVRGLVCDGASVEFQTTYRHINEKIQRQHECKWHVVASAAEGFGLSMAEAVSCGVPIVWSGLPVFDWSWQLGDVGRIAMLEEGQTDYREVRRHFTLEALATAVKSVIAVNEDDVRRLQQQYTRRLADMSKEFTDVWCRIVKRAQKHAHLPRLPRQMPRGSQPKVAVITVTRNRAAWWPNMVQNFVTQDWPISHLEWIIVDDGDEGQRLESRVAKLREDKPGLTVRYIGLKPGQSIGAKRNAGVRAASPDASLFMMMDDDDHYPSSSVASRASWLSVPGVNIAYCSVIYMYDIPRYISAINTPPTKDNPAQRVSEATLTFNRTAFERRQFPDVSMAEGEAFMTGRYADSMEIPPAGIIVSFIHKGNTSSRRIPKDEEPNGCHYGFSDDYFRWLFSVGA